MSSKLKPKNSKSAIKNRSKSIQCERSENDPVFDVKTSNIMGRYLVARKVLRAGEVILSEEPLVVGPCTGCKVQCLGCYANLEEIGSLVPCPRCGWPMCSSKCAGIDAKFGHTALECTILKECKSAGFLQMDDLDNVRTHYQAIVPLRCLLLKTSDPTAYDSLMNMENHNEIRRNLPDVWNGDQINVVDRILNEWHLTEFTHQEIHTICGVLEVNAFEIGQQGVNIRGVYPTAYLMSHDCVPNTNHTDEVDHYRLTVRASTEIAINQPITISYAYTLQCTLKRRQHLLENKFFECHCKRCSDPTELGTNSGALLCPKCRTGLVLSDNPLDMDSTWSCTAKECVGYRINGRSMRLLLDRIGQEIDQIDCNDIIGFETMLQKYRNVLHPTHFLFLGIKISLSQLYGKISGYLIQDLSRESLVRKRDICREILHVFNVIEPGFTRIRGVTLYELHAPLMLLLTRSFGQGEISKDELKSRLTEIVQCLNEANVILANEPPTSPEGIMGEAARTALQQISDWDKLVARL